MVCTFSRCFGFDCRHRHSVVSNHPSITCHLVLLSLFPRFSLAAKPLLFSCSLYPSLSIVYRWLSIVNAVLFSSSPIFFFFILFMLHGSTSNDTCAASVMIFKLRLVAVCAPFITRPGCQLFFLNFVAAAAFSVLEHMTWYFDGSSIDK